MIDRLVNISLMEIFNKIKDDHLLDIVSETSYIALKGALIFWLEAQVSDIFVQPWANGVDYTFLSLDVKDKDLGASIPDEESFVLVELNLFNEWEIKLWVFIADKVVFIQIMVIFFDILLTIFDLRDEVNELFLINGRNSNGLGVFWIDGE